MKEVFSDWTISKEVFEWIRKNIQGTILELGSGEGTQILSQYYKMYSIEDSLEWVGRYNSNYIYAPIVNNWYDTSKLILPEVVDLIIVDGPRYSYRRKGFIDNLHLFPECPIIIDDTHREVERKMAQTLNGNKTILQSKNKQAIVIENHLPHP